MDKTFDFDSKTFKSVIEEVPTKEAGWSSVYDGILRKDFPGTPMIIRYHLH